jgi:hypothetical protein
MPDLEDLKSRVRKLEIRFAVATGVFIAAIALVGGSAAFLPQAKRQIAKFMGKERAYVRETSHEKTVIAPWGKRDDWHAFLIPKDYNAREAPNRDGNNTDDSQIIGMSLSLKESDTDRRAWDVVATYIWREQSKVHQDVGMDVYCVLIAK